ncbi:Nicotinate phosphoribosyltransferase 2 [Porphyromonas cangingivalis]|uniref:nicotinate phosphoribosyltransferase n=1 Tax=Porphyromonas cangingivalis TaxID=36874 RepID=UPI000D8BFBE9|nr:nicotinate phosphoribosyltransferase [Porphyromonas cangingivalis]SPY34256.1 Nicotinate phosphoribosyltransferase 2 [Porphyromonas cangingivalis]
MSECVIKSLLDTDLYKFTTGYAYSKLFPRACGQFRFVDRDGIDYPEGFVDLVRAEIQKMSEIALSAEEETFLYNALPYLPPTYIDFLKGYRFNPSEVTVDMIDGRLSIVAEGLLYRITLWETPILALVSELYFKVKGQTPDMDYLRNSAIAKAKEMRENDLRVSLFGMRRRFSGEVEDLVTGLLKEYGGDSLFGTSNMYYAMKHGLRVTGTHPHEWVQFHGAIYGYKMANYMSMEHWIDVYDGDLGTVLTDTYTTDVFMLNFSKKHANLFTSLRHDSGDPLLFTDKALARYAELRIDPTIKYIVFSDSLNIPKAVKIKEYCDGKIGATFGIGTNLTNDVGNNIKPLNIVMKLFKCRMSKSQPWQDCVKLSDVAGKHTGSENEIRLAKETLGII